VTARDKDTGAEQTVTVSDSTNLDQGEVERMVSEAQQNAQQDRQRREEIDARNELDALAYRAEQLIQELGDNLPMNERARAEALVADARQALQEEAGIDRVRPLISDLQQIVHSLPAAASAAQQAGAGAPSGGGPSAGAGDGGGAAADDEEVVDAEFTRE
jgi:molecular chaperone DnaK